MTAENPGDPCPAYKASMRSWKRARAVLGGEAKAKEYDAVLDHANYNNLLVPFSPDMTQGQFNWFRAEAELPGLSAQYSRVILGGLLRKEPVIQLPEGVPEDALDWLRNRFTSDDKSLLSFLDELIREELVTSRSIITVDFPVVENFESLTAEQRADISPYPILWDAEDLINWQTRKDPVTGVEKLSRAVLQYYEADYSDNAYHPDYKKILVDHFLDEAGVYTVQYWEAEGDSTSAATNQSVTRDIHSGHHSWTVRSGPFQPMMHGSTMDCIPLFFGNDSMDPVVPVLTNLVDREVALYNKVSRRNHLLYGAATYTPVIKTNMSDEDFQRIVGAGLGSWIKLSPEDDADVLKTPTEALVDMDRAIASNVEELARLGIRILSPDSRSGDSGIALEIRNSAQTAQLASLNTRVSQVMTQVLALMLHWRYGEPVAPEEINFTLSADFNPSPLGHEWLRLITEWYESRLIPRSAFIEAVKTHDLLPANYDDEEAQAEIGEDDLIAATAPVEIQED